VLGFNRKWISRILSCLLFMVLSWSLVSCGDNQLETSPSKTEQSSIITPEEKLSEVPPPILIQQLRQTLAQYQPQVTILSPKADEILQDTTVNLQVQVRDLPIFENPELKMGPHLQVILDNQSYGEVYDLDQPIVFTDLTPGTHTLRLFASRPWHESFKNDGAYAQTTFHIFAKTDENAPDSSLPLLTYSSPKGNYGAEPILLDFYLTNAPLHLLAQEDPDSEIGDWRIRATINGQSFLLDTWEPIYLEGFKPGKNWVQLEFIDGAGNNIANVFNNTAKLITYQPNGQDTLSRIVRGEVELEAVRGIVDPNYQFEPITSEEEAPDVETATPKEETIVEETTIEEVAPPEEEVTIEEVAPAEEETTIEEVAPPEEETTIEETLPEQEVIKEEVVPVEEVIPEQTTEEKTFIQQPTEAEKSLTEDLAATEASKVEEEASKSPSILSIFNLFNGFFQPKANPNPSPEVPVTEESNNPEAVVVEETPIQELIEPQPSLIEQTPVVEEETAVVEEQATTVEESIEQETPVVEEETVVVEEQATTVEESIEEETPVVEEETAVVEEQATTVEESIEEETPVVEKETSAVKKQKTSGLLLRSILKRQHMQ